MSKKNCFSLFSCFGKNVETVFPSDKAAVCLVDIEACQSSAILGEDASSGGAAEQSSISAWRESNQSTPISISRKFSDAGSTRLLSTRTINSFSQKDKYDSGSTDERPHSVPLIIGLQKVLIVEDVPTNYMIMRRALERYKSLFTILQRNPIRTLAEARTALTGADIIILDNNLAGEYGDNAGLTLFEELVDLWKIGEGGKFPVICFASSDNVEIKESKINKQTLMARGLTSKQADSILTCVLYTTDCGAATVKTITRSCRKAIQKALTNRPVYQEEIKNMRCCCIC